ncbi:tetratricopeptide repeat protein [Aliidiomarina halalkaliphila]|uniref:Tetratricopeptide repeat protein n=1 Tax=Aliidiomarina halalkaliphila TaxID=2593535 RepID=A0A552X519_9GAMM|nr:tetratricopeptide repeat protein [Aliidiomarina halalkaliphila]TRW50121.1 tetratricopeptide repeat protein [Aliidiomarina halalkaliphila]
MKTRITTTLCAAVVAMGLLSTPTVAQNTDVGFTIPTRAQVEEQRDSRRSQALGDRVARRVMDAFELYEADDIRGAIQTLEGATLRTDYDRAYVARFKGTMYAALEDDPRAPALAVENLRAAVTPDVLGWNDQRAGIQLLGNLYLTQEDYANALVWFERYLKFTGEWDPDILVRMASSHMELRNYDRVIPFAEKAIEHYDEPNRNPYLLMIAAFYETNNVSGAINALERGITAMPGERGWWTQLAMFYMLNENFDRALATMKIAYDAGYVERENDYRALVQLFSNNGIPYHAGEVMTRHIDRGDVEGTASNFANAARAYHSAREFRKAADAYRQAIAASDDSEQQQDYYRRIGDALLLAERYREAAPAFQEAIRLLPRGEDAGRLYMSLAEAYFYSNQYRQAHDAAVQAQRFSSTRRNAESWANYIKDTAERRGHSI